MRRRAAAVLLLVAVTGACTSSSGADGGGRGDGDSSNGGGGGGGERIETQVVPLPDTVTAPRFPWWSADGQRLLFAGTPEDGERVEIMSVAPDGSELACLTCDVSPDVTEPLLKPIAFPDGKRVAVRVGNQSPVRSSDHAILECTPSVTDCDEAELVPVVPPAAGDPSVVQDQRELREAPDGEHVGLTQVRTSATGESTLVAIVAGLHRTADAYELDDPRVVDDRGELKSFTPDGERVLVAVFTPGPYETANPDVVAIDLATGEEERITSAPDYDEPLEYSPDGDWYAVGSGRESGLFEAVSQVRRPSLLGTTLDPLTGALFAGYRPDLLEGWVVRDGAEDGGEPGQRIPSPDDGSGEGSGDSGYDTRPIWNWRPDGTAIAFWQGRGSGFETQPTDTRLAVAELVDREPTERPSPDSITFATPDWAPELAGFVPPGVPLPESQAGRHSGSATVEVTETAGGMVVEVTYDGYSDDGEWVVDGTERADRRGGTTHYTADLTLSGDHEGYLQADADISVGAIEGEITSSVDGHELTLPPPAAAPAGNPGSTNDPAPTADT